MSNKVLFAHAKETYSSLGLLLRRIRFNANLLQSEMAKTLELKSPSYLSKIELGGMMDESTFEILKVEYHLTDSDIQSVLKYIKPKSAKRKKKFDPLKMNLGTYVAEIRKEYNLTQYQLSKALEEVSYFIGSIETHNQPFTEQQLDKFILFFQLTDMVAEELRTSNDYFELQPKARQLTVNELIIARAVKTNKFNSQQKLREFVYKQRRST